MDTLGQSKSRDHLLQASDAIWQHSLPWWKLVVYRIHASHEVLPVIHKDVSSEIEVGKERLLRGPKTT